MAITLPRYGSSPLQSINCKTVAKRLAVDLRLARDLAMGSGTNHGVTIAEDGLSYAIYKEPGGPLVQVGDTRYLTTATLLGNRHAAFDSKGSATVGSDGIITVQVGSKSYTLAVVLATGFVRVKDVP